MEQVHIEHVQRQYTDNELLEFGRQAAQFHENIRQLEDERKQASDHFKGQITEAETAISELSTRITRGYEIIPTPCDVVFDQPTKGLKQYVCRKTLNIIKTVPMVDADRPGPLFGE
jgi:hypothetical protein